MLKETAAITVIVERLFRPRLAIAMETALKRLCRFFILSFPDFGKLRRESFYNESVDRMLSGEEQNMAGFFYGYSEELLRNLEVLEGTLDVEKFLTGDYILLTHSARYSGSISTLPLLGLPPVILICPSI